MDVFEHDPIESRMPEVLARPAQMVALAIAIGAVMEIALHTWLIDGSPPGLGVTLGVAAAAIGLSRGGHVAGTDPSPASIWLYAASVGCAFLISFRASPVLAFINICTALAILGMAVATHHRDAELPTTITDFVNAGKNVSLAGAFGALLVAGRDLPATAPGTSWGTARRILIGGVIALPLLLVFGGLFVSADEVFGDAFRRLATFDLPEGLVSGGILAGMMAWILLGLIRRAAIKPLPRPEQPRRSHLGLTESLTIMWLLNGLFSLFVGFQLFELVASYQAASISYAQQARNGFFQLVAAATIVVALVLMVDWLVETDTLDRPRLRFQQSTLIVLTAAVLVSAFVRMGFYVAAYGLTELRVYSSTFMAWIAFLLFWMIRTVLAGRRRQFARPALAAALALVLLLNLVNPDGIIASYNLDHPARSGPEVDTTYLVSGLSADAIPAIVQRLDAVGEGCAQLALIERFRSESPADIRSWNLATSRASALLNTARTRLQGSCQSS